jgi:dienelactone hydrolase
MISTNFLKIYAGSILLSCLFTSCNNNESKPSASAPVTADSTVTLKEETVTFKADGATLDGYIAYNDSIKGKRPAILVLPEWWGLNDYVRMRARMLAQLGYVAMAVDVYGDGKVADNPDSAGAYAKPFYADPGKAKIRIDSAIAKIRTYDMVDPNAIGAIGYCFGGGLLLNTVRLGDDLKGVVSFHGALIGVPARKDLLRTKILICHGNADQFVTPLKNKWTLSGPPILLSAMIAPRMLLPIRRLLPTARNSICLLLTMPKRIRHPGMR